MAMNEQVKPARQSGTVKKLLLATVLGGYLTACEPIVDQRGYVFNDQLVERLEIGKTSAEQTIALLGSATTTSNLNGKTLYYIHSRFVRESYRAPKEVDRKVMAIYFGPDDVMRDVGVYGLEDGIIISIVERTTQTQGAELSIIAQLFSNVGRFGDGGGDGGNGGGGSGL
jgi:outer membrane protein assembly factor BamE (lipoprotein component of BamABCDE complex)